MASRDEILRFVYSTSGDDDLSKTSSLLVKMADNGKLADEESLALANSLKSLATQSKAVNDALSQKAGLGETTNQLKDAQAALAKYRAETDTTVTSSKKYQAALTAAETSVASLTSKQNLQQVALTKTLGGLEKAGVDTTNLAAASEKLGAQGLAVATSLAKVGTAATAASASTSKIAGAAETVKDSFVHVTEGVGEFIKKAGEITGITGIIAGVAAAISGFKLFEVGVEEATHFDQALGKLRATSELTGEEFEGLKQKIEDISLGLDETATDGARAAGKLASSFGDANKAIAALPATLELAKAAQIDVAQSADIVAESIKAFGLEAGDAGKIADVLATTSLKTGQDLSTLAATFTQIAPLAKGIGLDFQDTAAILGTLAQKGIDSEKALGGLRILFDNLHDPTSTLRQDLVGLGINTASFQTIIEGLAAAGPRAEAALNSLGSRGKTAILALVQDGGAGIGKFRQQLDDTAGAAKTAGDRIENNLLDAFVDFGKDLSNLAGGVLSKALDPIKVSVQSLTEKIKGIPDSAGFKAIQTAIGDFAASAAKNFNDLIESINFDQVGKSIADFVNSGSKGLSDFGTSIKAFGAGAATFANSIAAVFHSAEAAIFGVAAAGAKAVQSTIAGIAVLTGQLGALSNPASVLGKTFEAFGDSAETNFARAKAAGSLAADNFNAVAGSLDTVKKSADAAGSSTANVAAGLDKTAASAASASSGIEGIGHSFDTAADRVDGVANSLGILPELFDKTGSAASQGLGEVAAGLGKIGPTADQLRAQITQVAFRLGELSGTEKDGGAEAEALKDKLIALDIQLQGLGTQKAVIGVNDLKAAFAGLKVTSQKDLDDAAGAAKKFFDAIDQGSANDAKGLADRQNAFIAYANAALKAAANIDKAHVDSKQIELDSKASALGLSEALDKVKKSGTDAGKSTSTAFRDVPSDITRVTDSLDKFSQAGNDAAGSVGGIGDSAGQSAEHVGQFSDTASRAIAQMGKDVGDSLKGATADLSQFSETAREEFANAQDAALQFGIHSSADLQQYVTNLNAANAKIEENVDAQKAAAQTLIDSFANITDAQLKQQAASAGGAAALVASMQGVVESIRAGQGQFAELNDADLSRVQQAAEAAAQRVQEISDAAKQARADLASMGDDLQDQIDQINGNQDDIEDRRFQNQLKQLHDQAEASDLLNSAEYQDAVSKANTLHQLKLQQIEQEAQAQKNANDDVASSNPNSPQNSDAFNGPSGSSGRAPPNGDNAQPRGPQNGDNATPRGQPPATQQTTNNNLSVPANIVLLTGDSKSVDGLARALLPAIQKLLGNKF